MEIKKVILKNKKIRYRVRYRERGKRHQLSFEKEKEAKEFLLNKKKDLLVKKKTGMGLLPDLTFKTEAERWLKIRGSQFSKSHQMRAKKVLGWFLREFGHLPPERINANLLYDLQVELLDRGLKPKSVNNNLEIITAILNFSFKSQRIPFHPAHGLRKLTSKKPDMLFLESSEVEQFLDFTAEKYPVQSPKRWIYVVYLTLLNTAIRSGECWGLMPKDLKIERGVINIQRQWNRMEQTYGEPKWDSKREVPLNRELYREMNFLIKRRNIKLSDPLFQNKNGKPICHENFDKRVFRVDVKEAGITPITLHSLRHTSISLMVQNQIDAKTIQDIAGHKDSKTTPNYTHRFAGAIQRVAETFWIGMQSDKATKLKLIK